MNSRAAHGRAPAGQGAGGGPLEQAPPPRPPIELGVGAWVGHYAPRDDASVDAGPIGGGRIRARWSERWGIEAAGLDRGGVVGSADVLTFFGDPSADLVVHAQLGYGWQGGQGSYVAVGTGVDIRLFVPLDLHVDGQLRLDGRQEAALVFTAGPQLHSPRRYDRDGDGVSDRDDACPQVAEDLDGHADDDGCVDPDDGLLDAEDACRLVAEDRDGFLDRDGCPSPTTTATASTTPSTPACAFPRIPTPSRTATAVPSRTTTAISSTTTPTCAPTRPRTWTPSPTATAVPSPTTTATAWATASTWRPSRPSRGTAGRTPTACPIGCPPSWPGPPLALRFKGATPTRASRETLALVASVLSSFPAARVEVCVAEPEPGLATARAQAVVDALVAGGVDPARLQARPEAGPSGVRLELAR